MDVFVAYARFIGKPTAQLNFYDMLKMVSWAERRLNIFVPSSVKKLKGDILIKKEVRK